MRSERVQVDRPILIVGCGRSGTTVVYELLCEHPDLSWFSNYSEKAPWLPPLAGLNRLFGRETIQRLLGDRAVRPSEGYPIWDSCRPRVPTDLDRPLTEDDVAAGEAERIRRVVQQHLRFHGKSRFLNKNTRNSRRIRYLSTVFPDARFIHVIRDPLATAASLLKVAFWPDLRIWAAGGATPREWEARGGHPAELAARLWVAEVAQILDDSRNLGPGRYMEIRYEEFTSSPEQVMDDILRFAELRRAPELQAALDRAKLQNQNFKVASRLTADQIGRINQITAPLARAVGYMGTLDAAVERS